MGQTNMSIRVDEDVKREAETLFAKLGLTISAATNVFYQQAVRTQGIPFPLTIVDAGPQMQARKEFGEAIKAAQEQSVINGTDKQFEVGYDNATEKITIKSGQPYAKTGGEMAKGDGKVKTATPTPL